MINKSLIYEVLINSVRNRTDAEETHYYIANNLTRYLLDNWQVTATYKGVIPVGSTDPLSGKYTFNLQSVTINGNSLKKGATSLQGWLDAIILSLRTAVFKPVDITNKITVTPILALNLSPLMLDIHNFTNFEESHRRIAESIYNSITTSTPTCISPSAVSLLGSGTITIGKFL